VEYLTGSPTFFLAGNIAKQKWCHFESIIRCRENEEIARRNVEQIKERGGGSNYYEIPVVEPSVYVIPNLKSLLPINSKSGFLTPPGESFEKVLNLETGEAALYAKLDAAKFKKHFGEFHEPVKITYSQWRTLSGRVYPLHETGDLENSEFAEKYPTVKAFWEWEGHCIVGIPDGLTDEFVYEFKSVSSYYLLHYLKPVAQAQAGLYAYFLDRPKTRVQIRVKQANKIETYEQKSSPDNAVELLKTMAALLEGEITPLPPGIAWKCKNCTFRTICPHVSPA
jgi:CRISPR/Cas system-associated exonuclease Cas4 (RecB family)